MIEHQKIRIAGTRTRTALGDAERLSLFLDIDGTLLGIAPTPDAVHVPAKLVQVLEQVVVGLDGAVAVLTGRRIADADRLLAPLKLVAGGVHGTELRSEHGGEMQMLAAQIIPEFVDEVGRVSALAPGILVEQKGAGMAVHYRSAPDAGPTLIAELARIVANPAYGMSLRPGRMVVELLPQSFSKATALKWLSERPPFKGRVPVMIGDDCGDEPALELAERMGGLGLRVAGEHFPRSTADFDGVDGVRAWLGELARRLEHSGHLAGAEAHG